MANKPTAKASHYPKDESGFYLPSAPSAKAHGESREASKLVGCGELLGLGDESEFLIARWETRARTLNECASQIENSTQAITAMQREKARAFLECASDLRRQMELTKSRQPSPNTEIRHEPPSAPKPNQQ